MSVRSFVWIAVGIAGCAAGADGGDGSARDGGGSRDGVVDGTFSRDVEADSGDREIDAEVADAAPAGEMDAARDATREGGRGTADGGSRDAGARDGATGDGAVGDGGAELPVPAAVVRALSATPYVEERCAPTRWTGWPYAAQRCTYRGGLQVTVANPSPDRVARWIVDGAQQIPAVASLRTRDPANYEACLVRIAQHTMSQSSRIFPLEGDIWEGEVFPFLRGVTYGVGTRTGFCGTCFCRINSLTRSQWCTYRAATMGGTESACLASFGGTSGWNVPWSEHCLANHVSAWTQDFNDHYRAQAFWANRVDGATRGIAARVGNPATASGASVLAAVQALYPVY
jgi:hypothetical protein